MNTFTRRSWLQTLGWTSLLGTAVVRSSAWPQTTPTRWRNITARESIRARIPNVEVIAHTGQKFRFFDDLIYGKRVIINFMYAQCEGICVPMTQNLVKVQEQLRDHVGKDLFIYSITLKPEQDDVAALHHYAEMHGVGPGWLFLTGRPEDMEALRVALGFTDPDPVRDADKSNHIGNLLLGNEPELSWCAGPGQIDPDFLVRRIRWNLYNVPRYELENRLLVEKMSSKGEPQ
ncbi:MAG: SCO family protein [Firmicutes bacterium]|nr:SCO family protein [Bacillota bacterium]